MVELAVGTGTVDAPSTAVGIGGSDVALWMLESATVSLATFSLVTI